MKIRSGSETRGFDQAHLIAPCGEFPALIALDDDAPTGFDTDHPGPNPAKRCRFEHLDDITGLKIQLHLHKFRDSDGAIGRAVEDLNPRHQVLETCVLPTELTAQGDGPWGTVGTPVWKQPGDSRLALSGRTAA